jgi:outer membrane protein assembly factor BamA
MRISSKAGWMAVLVCMGGPFLAPGAARAQDSSATTVRLLSAPTKPTQLLAVIVQGNDRTKEEIILREMRLQPGDTVTTARLEADQKRIESLDLFNRVQMFPVATDNGVILVVDVTERWYIYPFPILFRSDGSWSKISYGAGIVHTNFRGRNELLDLSGWLGFNPGITLSYSNPWIGGPLRLYTKLSLFYRRIRNKTFELGDEKVDENHLGLFWHIGRRFGYDTWFSVGFGYETLHLSPPVPGQTLSPSGRDNIPRVVGAFTYDGRDHKLYPKSGWYFRVWGERAGLWEDRINYTQYGLDVRRYQPLGKLTLALRAAGDFSQGLVPVYDRYYLGYANQIRGHYKQRDAGENLVLGNVALRFPIRKITYHNLSDQLGSYARNLPFGISGALFVDTGAIWYENQKLVLKRFLTGYGAGLHFHVPYFNLLRFDVALDEDRRAQWIIEVDTAF